tara:strand:+ start:337 stop:486 length:150 start_codon:yes stop_codon:yes gene_type:complete
MLVKLVDSRNFALAHQEFLAAYLIAPLFSAIASEVGVQYDLIRVFDNNF